MTAQPHSDISQLRETIREMEARSHELSNFLLGLDHRVQPTEETLTAQRDLVLTRDLIKTLGDQLAELEAEQAREHARRGQLLAAKHRSQLTAIFDQRVAASNTVADIDRQRRDAATAATADLAEYPQHLAELTHLLPLYENDVTRLAGALIALRRELSKHGDIFGFFEKSGLAAPWFRIEIGKRADWAKLDLAEVEQFLAAYRRQRAL